MLRIKRRDALRQSKRNSNFKLITINNNNKDKFNQCIPLIRHLYPSQVLVMTMMIMLIKLRNLR